MRSYKAILFILFCLCTVRSTAQFGSDTILAKDNVLIPLPMVSLNFGIGNLMSDVKLNNGPSPFKQFGYQLTITQRVTKFLNASFELYGGTVYGEEQRGLTNLNFKTSLFSQRLNIEYNFYPLLKPNDRGIQLIRPYVGFGLGMLSFRSKGDLRSSNGSSYHYWSDGLIYAEAEGTVDVSEATLLQRDFVYESDLRDANLDGLRKYSQLTFSLPINAGIRFQITKNIGLNAAFAYALNFSDMLDNVSTSGIGDRAGTNGNDNHMFGSLGLTVYLGTTKPTAKPKKATPEELAAIAKAKAEAKRADQKAAKEQAAEATKQADVNMDQPDESAKDENAAQTESGAGKQGDELISDATSEATMNGQTTKSVSGEDSAVGIDETRAVATEKDKKNHTKTSTSESDGAATTDPFIGQSPDASTDSMIDQNSVVNESAQNKVVDETSGSGNQKGSEKNGSGDVKGIEIRTANSIDKLETSTPKKTGNFHWADLDNDGMISPTEVLHFIDLLFEGESERSVEDIQFLIDYYFDQE